MNSNIFCYVFSYIKGGTILGEPTEIVSLGQSELPYDIFLSYLEELSLSSFRFVVGCACISCFCFICDM